MDSMCEVNPKHEENVRVKNGVNILYLQLLKDLYVYMESELLWYGLYSKTLESHGFAVNPHDRCIANITINCKKFTIAWYIDNNKVLLIDK